jgi:integrase
LADAQDNALQRRGGEAGRVFERAPAKTQSDAKVFLVRECQKSMDRTASLVGMARITHHDLRHFFATVAIESGVDVPTVSRWLGHKDGGALAMKPTGTCAKSTALRRREGELRAGRREAVGHDSFPGDWIELSGGFERSKRG